MNRSLPPRHRSAHPFRRLLASAVSMVVASTVMRAQTPPAIGPSIGYSFGVPLTVERASGVVNRYGEIRPGSSRDHALWFGVAALADGVPGEGWELAGELGLVLSSGHFTSDPFQFGIFYDSVADTFVSPNRSFDLTSTASAAQLDVAVGRRLGERWSLRLGAWLQYRLASDFIQTESLLDQPNVAFGDSTRSHLVTAGAELGGTPLRYGALLCGALDIPAGEMLFVPRADLRLDLPALLDGLGLRALRVGGGVSLLFDHRIAPPPAPAVDAPPPPIPPPPLRATIELFAIADDSSRSRLALVGSHETLHKVLIPFPTTMGIDDVIDGAPRYARLTPEEADRFSLRSLARLEPRELDRQILNVLGYRLRSEPDAAVTLRYPEKIAAHAIWLRDYLRDVWRIEPARIELRRESSPSSHGVAIGSSSDAVTAPIRSEWMSRELRAPALGMVEQVEAGAGLRAWNLTIATGARELARYDGTSLPELRSVDLSLRLDGRSIEGTTPLVATLTVIDSASDTVVARDTMELHRDSVAAERSTLAIYVLTRDGDGGAVVDKAVADLPAQATVTIVSAADARGGEGERAAELLLARLRARGVRVGELHVRHARPGEGLDRALPVAGVEIIVEGNER